MTLFEKFRQEGRAERRAEGRIEGLRDTLLLQLEVKFGTLTSELKGPIQGLPADRLRELLVALFKAQSL